ncbi:DEAD/DEAH box helicase [Aneurinibacillus sp. Ricciae_BoGa-3]|uniref:DEAD/DEAH box helicase n=1 Tax=Aneurinibacillus sp. Ricciae_BoGa-3 TaxID=3022697 RepID=UPI00233F9817|nr:DEAD/DEAH box helicase [Aneurinibacillus sp. Ricciae_BoGa-3]WCK56022.1 DEAD/DEAH box helicase [Aneurinibacillus sp. Ricciae_BoGa-3]
MAIFSALAPFLQQALESKDIKEPTDIQQAAIPLLMDGKSVVGESHTGTGKTLAYLLPILQRIDPSADTVQAIIFSPTRELTMQIAGVVAEFCKGTDIRSQAIIGGVDIKRQMDKLKERPHIIIGSPGRMVDLLDKRKLKVHEAKMIVVDEVDELVEARMLRAMETVMMRTPRDRQLAVFSATISESVEEWSRRWAEEVQTVRIKASSRLPEGISHAFIVVPERQKFEELRRLLVALNPERAVIFVKKLHRVQEIASWLAGRGVKIVGIHSETKKLDREAALRQFRNGDVNCLVTTDLLARGLDIEDITHVINFDLPMDPQDYIHRVGRTGRVGKKGLAVTLLEPKEKFMAGKFGDQLGITLQEKSVLRGSLVDARPHKAASREAKPAAARPKDNKKPFNKKHK